MNGLCSDLENKNAESITYHFDLDRKIDLDRKTMQYLIGQSQWDDIPLREELVRQVAEQLGEANGILALDPCKNWYSRSRDIQRMIAYEACSMIWRGSQVKCFILRLLVTA